ncbi:minor capsid protein [Gordonia sp. PP30]|uniref:minor capsid protein n=1 Tax=Gordonia sp. PP30 TaxID=2935861 RepID=UPI00200028C5|nr:minor capsid protein [Gordonia sp. PP30]UQE74193.1 minor capsid protein [Gordonia sp. PP30]
MAARMPTITDVLDALARRLTEAGVAAYSPDGAYPTTPAAPPVFFGQLYPTPDLQVAISHYWTDPNPMTQRGNPTVRVQLRWRGDKNPTTVHSLADAAYAALHTMTPGLWPGGVRILWCSRQLVAPIEPDANGRWERADSYEIQCNPIGA